MKTLFALALLTPLVAQAPETDGDGLAHCATLIVNLARTPDHDWVNPETGDIVSSGATDDGTVSDCHGCDTHAAHLIVDADYSTLTIKSADGRWTVSGGSTLVFVEPTGDGTVIDVPPGTEDVEVHVMPGADAVEVNGEADVHIH